MDDQKKYGAISGGMEKVMGLRPTQIEILRQKKKMLELELKAVNEALEALESPELERVLEVIRQAIHQTIGRVKGVGE